MSIDAGTSQYGALDGPARKLLDTCAAYLLGRTDANPDLSRLAYAFRSQRNRLALISYLADKALHLSDRTLTVRQASMELFTLYCNSEHCVRIAVCPVGISQLIISKYHPDTELFMLKPLRDGIEPDIG